jgi:hypothetical protein
MGTAMSDDKFFDRVRKDASGLRYEADAIVLTRMSARIRARVAAPPTVAQLLAAWFRPLAATFSAVALAAVIGLAFNSSDDRDTLGANPVVISMAGDDVSVGD